MEVRINKFLSEAGVCSRREADRQIEEGNVTIDGKIAQMGDRVSEGQQVCFQGVPVKKEEEMILIALHKPAGIVCTAEKREKNNVIDYLNYPKRIYPVGRLDKDTTGLLLLTNDGALAHELLAPNKHVTKKYRAKIAGVADEETVEIFASGMTLGDGTKLKPAELKILIQDKEADRSEIEIEIQEGKYHQIKRMFGAVGMKVIELDRISMGKLVLPTSLKRGEYKEISLKEIK